MMEIDSKQSLYEKHESFADLIIGAREGKYYQGKFMISRTDINLATV
jgi:hypothetical protein